MWRPGRLIACIIALFATLCGGAWALEPVPALAARVTDLTGTLNAAQRNQIEQKLATLEGRKGSQLAVLIVPSTRPESIEQYSIRVVDAWKLGRKGVDDGVLLLIAKDDRKLRIEVGRGLEGAIPDAFAKRIIEDHITPHFRAGRFLEGIKAGVDRIIGLVDGEPLPEPVKRARSDVGDVPDMVFQMAVVAAFAGPIACAIFGRLLGTLLGAGIAGVIAYVVSSSIVVAGAAAIAIGIVVLLFGSRGGGGGGGGSWSTGSGHGGGWSSGGGGFSGGGGGFSGGGASGGW